jgi:hypothetical protein
MRNADTDLKQCLRNNNRMGEGGGGGGLNLSKLPEYSQPRYCTKFCR